MLINCLAQDGRITVALVDGSGGLAALVSDYVSALRYPRTRQAQPA